MPSTLEASSSSAPKDLDYILDDLVGGGGRWQWTKMLFLIPVYVAMGTPLLLHMFTAYTPDHRCFVPGCDDINNNNNNNNIINKSNNNNNSLMKGNGTFASEGFLQFTLPKELSIIHI